jgi:ATP synthase protein I
MMLVKQQEHPQVHDLPQNNKTEGSQTHDRENSSNFMELMAQVSTLAWNLVIPIVGGVILGHYLDNRRGSDLTWTLSLLTLGVMIAFSNLYNLYIKHGAQKTQEQEHRRTRGDKCSRSIRKH